MTEEEMKGNIKKKKKKKRREKDVEAWGRWIEQQKMRSKQERGREETIEAGIFNFINLQIPESGNVPRL